MQIIDILLNKSYNYDILYYGGVKYVASGYS